MHIAFFGQKRCSKNTSADHLFSKLKDYNKWKRGSLGHAVKKLYSEHFGVSLDFIEEWKVKDEIPNGFNCTIRDGLTTIGDGWRNIKSDIWINKLFENNNNDMILDDGRYLNEAEYVKKHEGITILIWRPGFENNTPSRSEQEIMPFVRQLMKEPSGIVKHSDFPFDYWLVNDGTKEELYKKIDDIILPEVLKKL